MKNLQFNVQQKFYNNNDNNIQPQPIHANPAVGPRKQYLFI